MCVCVGLDDDGTNNCPPTFIELMCIIVFQKSGVSRIPV